MHTPFGLMNMLGGHKLPGKSRIPIRLPGSLWAPICILWLIASCEVAQPPCKSGDPSCSESGAVLMTEVLGTTADAATGPGAFLFWTQTSDNTVGFARLDGQEQGTITTSANGPVGLDYHPVQETLYVLNQTSDSILRVSLSDFATQNLTPSNMDFGEGLSVEPNAGLLYWADAGLPVEVKTSELDGSNPNSVVTTALATPADVETAPSAGYFYVADEDAAGGVFRYLIGSGTPDITLSANASHALTVDAANGAVYWIETPAGTSFINQSDLAGGGTATIVSKASSNDLEGIALDASGGKIYWSEQNNGEIWRANLDGSSQELFLSGLNGVNRLEIAFAPL